jgi:hypothetical protein
MFSMHFTSIQIWQNNCVGKYMNVSQNCSNLNPCYPLTHATCVSGVCVCVLPRYYDSGWQACRLNDTLAAAALGNYAQYGTVCGLSQPCDPAQLTICDVSYTHLCICASGRSFREGESAYVGNGVFLCRRSLYATGRVLESSNDLPELDQRLPTATTGTTMYDAVCKHKLSVHKWYMHQSTRRRSVRADVCIFEHELRGEHTDFLSCAHNSRRNARAWPALSWHPTAVALASNSHVIPANRVRRPSNATAAPCAIRQPPIASVHWA